MGTLRTIVGVCLLFASGALHAAEPAVQLDDREVPPLATHETLLDAEVPAPSPSADVPPAIVAPALPRLVEPRWDVRRRYDLLVTGAVMFGAGYLANVGAAAYLGVNDLYIPFLGPLFQISSTHAQSRGDEPPTAGLYYTLLALDSAAQLAGAVLAVVGAVWKQPRMRLQRIALVPSGSPTSAGLAVIAHF